MKQKIVELNIKCKKCGQTVKKVFESLAEFDNEWDEDEPTGWVKQRLIENDLAVMTHKPISCLNPLCVNFNQKIATLKLDFISRDNEAELTFK